MNRLLASDVRMFLAREKAREEASGDHMATTSSSFSGGAVERESASSAATSSKVKVAGNKGTSAAVQHRRTKLTTIDEAESETPPSTRGRSLSATAVQHRQSFVIASHSSGINMDAPTGGSTRSSAAGEKKRGLNDPPFYTSMQTSSAPKWTSHPLKKQQHAAEVRIKSVVPHHAMPQMKVYSGVVSERPHHRKPLSDANHRHGWTAPAW